ncbi:MAG: YcxB family protein [Victivallales bacterium]|nr:YcxB family protein [Victivallales bacterium]
MTTKSGCRPSRRKTQHERKRAKSWFKDERVSTLVRHNPMNIGLPLAYFFNFFLSVRRKSSSFTGEKAAYIIRLSEAGIAVTKGEQNADWSWDKVLSVYLNKQCIYIYTAKRQAFLLPLTSKNKAENAAWELIRRYVESTRIFYRK